MVAAFVGVEVPVTVTVVLSDSGAIPGTTVNVGVADEVMSPGDTGANAVIFAGLEFVLGAFGVVSLDGGEPPEAAVDVGFAGLKFVLGAFGVASLDDGEPSEAAVDIVVGLATRVTSSDVSGEGGGSVVGAAVRVSSAVGEAATSDEAAVETAAEVDAVRESSASSSGAL
jgi:hypothetical protein